jgi:hypothetical protein
MHPGTGEIIEELEEQKPQSSSIVIIFSFWSTMAGSAITQLPWAFQ